MIGRYLQVSNDRNMAESLVNVLYPVEGQLLYDAKLYTCTITGALNFVICKAIYKKIVSVFENYTFLL